MGQAGLAVFKDSFGAGSTRALYNLYVRSWDGRESVINDPCLTASSVPTAPRWVLCWAGAWCSSRTVTAVATAEGLQQVPGSPFCPPLCQRLAGLGMSFSATLPWRDLPLPYPGGWQRRVCAPLCLSQRGCGAWEWLGEQGWSWREQPESVLPSPPGQSCCSWAAALVALPWHSQLQHSPLRAVPIPGGSAAQLCGCLTLGPALCQAVMAWITKLAQFWKSWEMEQLQTPLCPGTSPEP